LAEKPFDVAIVGAGQAGCTLAGKIAEKGVQPSTGEPLRIAVLDQGPYFKGKPNPGYGTPQRRQMFTNVSQDFAGKYSRWTGMPPGATRKVPLQPGQEIFLQRAPAIFGGGTLHYIARTRAPFDIDMRVWEEETGADWGPGILKPYNEQIHRDFNIHVRPPATLCRLDHLVRDAALSSGYELSDYPIAKKNCLLSGYCDGVNMCKYDARQGSFTVYLPLAEQRGAEMIPNASAQRILIERSRGQARVTGLEYLQDGVRRTLEVPHVIVSCGNYGTPPLLYRSGYGPRELTDNLIVENRNVGRHTDNRPESFGPVGIFDEPVSDGAFRHGNAYYVYHDLDSTHRYDRLAISMWARTVPYPNQVAIDVAAPEFGRTHKDYMRDVCDATKMTRARADIARQCITKLEVVRPRNIRGWINEWGEQIYQGHDPSIVSTLKKGREVIYELLKKMGAREIVGMDSPVRVHHLEAFVGSCIVGTDPNRSVVNPYFESHDVEGLFICDGSVMPRASSQGYAGSVASLALLASSRIVERHFSRG